MVYRPVPSVTPDRTFSISTGLDASTVTPGSTAPDVSLTRPDERRLRERRQRNAHDHRDGQQNQLQSTHAQPSLRPADP